MNEPKIKIPILEMIVLGVVITVAVAGGASWNYLKQRVKAEKVKERAEELYLERASDYQRVARLEDGNTAVYEIEKLFPMESTEPKKVYVLTKRDMGWILISPFEGVRCEADGNCVFVVLSKEDQKIVESVVDPNRAVVTLVNPVPGADWGLHGKSYHALVPMWEKGKLIGYFWLRVPIKELEDQL